MVSLLCLKIQARCCLVQSESQVFWRTLLDDDEMPSSTARTVCSVLYPLWSLFFNRPSNTPEAPPAMQTLLSNHSTSLDNFSEFCMAHTHPTTTNGFHQVSGQLSHPFWTKSSTFSLWNLITSSSPGLLCTPVIAHLY